jgi:tripartite-type tricarboxylate transporter receptor subunit TctC
MQRAKTKNASASSTAEGLPLIEENVLKMSLLFAVLLSVMSASPLAHAQTYQAKPIRFLVGFPPSGTNDIVARLVAQKVSELIGQTVVVENRGGANTAIATEVGARPAANGYPYSSTRRGMPPIPR